MELALAVWELHLCSLQYALEGAGSDSPGYFSCVRCVCRPQAQALSAHLINSQGKLCQINLGITFYEAKVELML